MNPTPRPIKQPETRNPELEEFFRTISEQGSLGLLALGATGLIAWRKKRDAIRQSRSAAEETVAQEVRELG
ncbi:MAG: hypothetical protein KJ950_10440 [Proteobacteria bacterium]|nr:hypothetical protein [Pseudomonadota bacterium]MBU1685715.1 hypothetical protein [Pseudomonadota bacterium]